MPDSHTGLLQRVFEFYSVFFGVTAPPPEKQKWVLIALVAFFVFLTVGLVVFAKVVSSF